MNNKVSTKNLGVERMFKLAVVNCIQNAVALAFMGHHSTRSSVRTDKLHYDIKNIFYCLDDIKNFDKKNLQIRIDSDKNNTKVSDIYGGKMSCDLLATINGINSFVAFAKAPISSINQNFHTYHYSLLGEANRILGHIDNENITVVSLTFAPNQTFKFDSSGKVKGIEIVKKYTDIAPESKSKYYKKQEDNHKIVYVYYDLHEDILNAKTKDEIAEVIERLTAEGKPIVKNVDSDYFYSVFLSLYNSL